jgi:hypothetical protein
LPNFIRKKVEKQRTKKWGEKMDHGHEFQYYGLNLGDPIPT